MSFLFGSTTVTKGPDTRSLVLTESEPQKTEGTFYTQATVRVVNPWRNGVCAGVPMSLEIKEGNARFGKVSEVGDQLSTLGQSLVLNQHGQGRLPDRVYYLVGEGKQEYNTVLSKGVVNSQPGAKTAGEVKMVLHIEGQEDKEITYDLITGRDEEGVRSERTRHVVIYPYMKNGQPTADLATRIDDTCTDRCGDCVGGTKSCFWGSLAFGGRTLAGTWYTVRHPVESAKFAGRGVQQGVAWTFGLQVPQATDEGVDKKDD